MGTIQFIQISPEELSNLIKEGIKPELEELIRETSGRSITQKEFLSRQETASLFGISKVTLHDWINKGILHPYKMGNRTYFLYSELEAKLLSSNPHA